jgi:hypothetical protein
VSPSSSSPRIDDDWLQQWVAYGMLELAVYLTNHAMFADYLSKRDRRRRRPSRAKQS